MLAWSVVEKEGTGGARVDGLKVAWSLQARPEGTGERSDLASACVYLASLPASTSPHHINAFSSHVKHLRTHPCFLPSLLSSVLNLNAPTSDACSSCADGLVRPTSRPELPARPPPRRHRRPLLARVPPRSHGRREQGRCRRRQGSRCAGSVWEAGQGEVRRRGRPC